MNGDVKEQSGPHFVTVDEAAEILRVNRKTVYDAIKAGQVPGVQQLGRILRINRAALLSWSGVKA